MITKALRLRIATVSTCCVLLLTGTASAAAAVTFRGTTSQTGPISLTIARGFVKSLDFKVADRCSDGGFLVVHVFDFPPIRITRHSFAFTATAHPGEPTIVRGKVFRDRVAGSLRDTTVDVNDGDVCKGSATFVAIRK